MQYYDENKAVRRQQMAAWELKNRDERAVYKADRYQENRTEMLSKQSKWREANPGYNKQWKAENPEYAGEWRAANPGKVKAGSARYRARKACAVLQRWVRRLDHDDALCYWCGCADVEHVDHVHPISLGGPAVPSNEVPSCAPCNLRKRNKHPLVWIAELMEQT